MKNKITIVLLGVTLIISMLCQSCSEEKYTIWTDYTTYSEFHNAFQIDISDGYYIRVEISEKEWADISKNLNSEGRHKWNEETIRKWFISNGFGETEATKESSWLVVRDHGFIVSRTDNMVYFILK